MARRVPRGFVGRFDPVEFLTDSTSSDRWEINPYVQIGCKRFRIIRL